PIRMLTITGINLCDETVEEQISLFSGDNRSHQQGEKIERTMDSIRSRFGSAAITFGGVLGNDLGVDTHDIHEEE
ncbi:MAG: DNA polymerase IV, partial [Firmicutes bacterium]|nr:DNA polymerase IV [Bacillota bacterium]